MGDFLLDLRTRGERCKDPSSFQYFDGIFIDKIESEKWTLLYSRVGPENLWAPFESDLGVIIVVVGQTNLTESELEVANNLPGKGGLACKALFQRYIKRGTDGFSNVDGSCVIFIFEPAKEQIHLITDMSGAYPCFAWEPSSGAGVYSSHPDFLARSVGEDRNWDHISLAEFLITGRVSAPYSYYKSVRGLELGSVHSISLKTGQRYTRRLHDPANFAIAKNPDPDELARELAGAIHRATQRAVSPRLGRTAVALSGGLDSRTILCCSPEGVLVFCAIDEENTEFRIARRIAKSQGMELIPFKRHFDHYGTWAELAVQMTGGMGDIGSNHFLGFRQQLQEIGADNLVTGCYIDYLFKSLALDSIEFGILRREKLSDFSWEHYLTHFWFETDLSRAVRQRLEEQFPPALRSDKSDLGRLRVSALRTFPLFREGDNMQRIVPQKMISWHTPSLDRDVIDVYRQVPPVLRLNKYLFKRAVKIACNPAVCGIPDANTGVAIGASPLRVSFYRYLIALRRKWERLRPSMMTQESWPNWLYYLRHSDVVANIWTRPNAVADEVFSEITGQPWPSKIRVQSERGCRLMLRQLTLKIWLDQREGLSAN